MRLLIALLVACAEGAPPDLIPDAGEPSPVTSCPNRNDGRCLRVSIPRESWDQPEQVFKVIMFDPTMEHLEFVLSSWVAHCDGITDWTAVAGVSAEAAR